MSLSELTARRLYDTMQLGNVSEEVKRHLIILMLTNTSAGDNNDSEIETLAKTVAIDNEHMQEIKEHSYYKYEVPEQSGFVSEDGEIAYYDSMSDDDFLSEKESQRMMATWKNLL